jgi:lipopolysaccharide biosynthesis glycosyltransferase
LISAPDRAPSSTAGTRNGLKWFCAVSAATLDFYKDYNLRDLIRVAIFSAILNTRLRPHVIYDGQEDAYTDELRQLGAVVILHRTPLYDAFEGHAGENWMWRHVMAGAFLRFEIPVLETQEQFVLYTDCDVLFLRDPRFGRQAPAVFGATSQVSTDPRQDMNSGVMLVNVQNMGKLLPHLNEFTRRSLHLGLDQEILRAFFGSNYQVLDRSLNWKPYWGWDAKAQIIHFHGPKPAACRAYLSHGTLPDNETWAQMLRGDRAGYEAYTRLWYQYSEQLALHTSALANIRPAHAGA